MIDKIEKKGGPLICDSLTFYRVTQNPQELILDPASFKNFRLMVQPTRGLFLTIAFFKPEIYDNSTRNRIYLSRCYNLELRNI